MPTKKWFLTKNDETRVTFSQPRTEIDEKNCSEIRDGRGSWTIQIHQTCERPPRLLACRGLNPIDTAYTLSDYIPLMESICRILSEFEYGGDLSIFKDELEIDIPIDRLLSILNTYN